MGQILLPDGSPVDVPCQTEDVSDGYHTFAELYEHRCLLFIALLRAHPFVSWRANTHADGTMFEGWFIAGMHLPTGDVTYHMPVRFWSLLDGSYILTTLRAPTWDGHTAAEVLTRLETWLRAEAQGNAQPS